MEKEINKDFHKAMIAEYKKALKIAPTIEMEHVLVNMARNGRTIAEKTLFYLNYPLLIKYINPRNYWYYKGSFQDLMSMAYEGIKPALRNFDCSYGGHFAQSFIPYAIARVLKNLEADKLVHIPNGSEVVLNISSLNEKVSNEDGEFDIEMIDRIRDDETTESKLQMKHMLHDVKKVINSSDDKEDFKKLFKAYQDAENEEDLDGKNPITKTYLAYKTRFSKEKVGRIQAKLKDFIRQKKILV